MSNAAQVVSTTRSTLPRFREVALRDGKTIHALNTRGVVRFRVANGMHFEGSYSASALEKVLMGIPKTQKMVGLQVDSQKIKLTVTELRGILDKD